MRRLTEFEKIIVSRIFSSEVNGTDFHNLLKNFTPDTDLFDNVFFECGFVMDNCHLHHFERQLPVDLPENEKAVISYQNKLASKRLFDTINLINLLERNGLIHIEEGFISEEKKYFPYRPSESVEFLSWSSRSTYHHYPPNVLYDLVNIKKISDKDYGIIYSATFQPSEAMEIYVGYGFRTEEQKKYDDEHQFNKQSLTTAKYSALYAVIAVGVSAFFSALTLAYTVYHDYQNGNLKDTKNLIEHSSEDRSKKLITPSAKDEQVGNRNALKMSK